LIFHTQRSQYVKDKEPNAYLDSFYDHLKKSMKKLIDATYQNSPIWLNCTGATAKMLINDPVIKLAYEDAYSHYQEMLLRKYVNIM